MKTIPVHKVVGVSRQFEVAGKIYKMSPVTVTIIGLMDQWAREQPFDRLRMKLDKVGDMLPENIIERWCDDATKESEDADAVQREIQNISGVKKILWHCFVANHPEMSKQDFETIIESVGLEVLQDFLEKDNTIEGIDDKQDDQKKSD